MSGHTPGPWKTGRMDVSSYTADGIPIIFVYRGREETVVSRIAVTPYAEYDWDPDYDALLIAAAPDLLYACKLALEKCLFPVGAVKAKDALEKAIQKAEGSDGNSEKR